MKYILIFVFLSSVFTASANAGNKTITVNKWIDVANEKLPESIPVKSECRKIEFTEETKKSYTPEFPSKALRKKIQGYSILEFTIDPSGKALLEKRIISTDSIFEKQALSSLNNLKFITPSNWTSTCIDQVYRIGYAFKISSECTGKEFQKPTINICTMGMIGYFKNGRFISPNILEK